jgi:hypothetical protein
MKSIGPTTPYGYSYFCDDIRREIRGKSSHIGIYSGDLIIYRDFPVTLTKLCIIVYYIERPGESEEPVELRVCFPGEDEDNPRIRGMLPVEDLRKNFVPKDDGEDMTLTVRSEIEVVPCPLKEHGFIKVRAYRGDLEVRLGALLIRSEKGAPPSSDAAPKPT